MTTADLTMSAMLRVVADLLDEHHLPLPFVTQYGVNWSIYPWDVDDVAAAVADVRRAVGGKWDKSTDGGDKMALTTIRDGIKFVVEVDREKVCTRRVVGTETVMLPAVVAAPERTEEREIVEWDCDPILESASA
jgi:hypothetical protein